MKRKKEKGERRKVRGGSLRALFSPYSLLPTACLIFGISTLSAQDVGLTATAERNSVRLGEPVIVTVTARVPATIDTIGPVLADSAGLFQLLSIQRDDDEQRWDLELMTIDTGTVFLPPLAFGYTLKGDTVRKTAYANSLSFTVAGVTVAQDADIRDIKPPMSAPWRWEDIWPFLLGALVLGGGWYAYRRYRTAHAAAELMELPAPAVAPHVRALKELRILEEKQLWQQGRVKEYYSEATEIVRRFFEGRWKFSALEMTSEEILHALRATPDAERLRETLGSFFLRADLVKFAKAHPTPDDHADELEQAFTIVRAMTPAAPPEPQEAQPIEEVADVR